MQLRDFALAACLSSCLLWGTGLAQQAAPASGIAPPPEPHPAPAAAPVGPTVYNIELIVFRTNSTLGSPENWSAEAAQAPAVPIAGDGEAGAPVADAPTSVASGRFVRALTPAEFQLTDLEARIKSSGSYVAVAHVGWAQTASPWGSHESLSLQQLGIDSPLLAGRRDAAARPVPALGIGPGPDDCQSPGGPGCGPADDVHPERRPPCEALRAQLLRCARLWRHRPGRARAGRAPRRTLRSFGAPAQLPDPPATLAPST